jgi:hypothetical protein
MKNISFLYSSSVKKFPKTAFLLESGDVAVIDQNLEDSAHATEVSKKAIADTTIEDIIWWWPSGSAFREIYGVSEFGVINIFKQFGFTNISNTTRLKHTQVEDDSDVLMDYIEVKLSLTDGRYEELVAQYGQLKQS